MSTFFVGGTPAVHLRIPLWLLTLFLGLYLWEMKKISAMQGSGNGPYSALAHPRYTRGGLGLMGKAFEASAIRPRGIILDLPGYRFQVLGGSSPPASWQIVWEVSRKV